MKFCICDNTFSFGMWILRGQVPQKTTFTGRDPLAYVSPNLVKNIAPPPKSPGFEGFVSPNGFPPVVISLVIQEQDELDTRIDVRSHLCAMTSYDVINCISVSLIKHATGENELVNTK